MGSRRTNMQIDGNDKPGPGQHLEVSSADPESSLALFEKHMLAQLGECSPVNLQFNSSFDSPAPNKAAKNSSAEEAAKNSSAEEAAKNSSADEAAKKPSTNGAAGEAGKAPLPASTATTKAQVDPSQPKRADEEMTPGTPVPSRKPKQEMDEAVKEQPFDLVPIRPCPTLTPSDSEPGKSETKLEEGPEFSNRLFEHFMAKQLDGEVQVTEPEADWKSLPLEDRLASPNWEHRAHAYQELATTTFPNHPELCSEYTVQVAAWLEDKAASTHRDAFAATIAWFKAAPPSDISRAWEAIFPHLLSKFFNQARFAQASDELISLAVTRTQSICDFEGPIYRTLRSFISKTNTPTLKGLMPKSVAKLFGNFAKLIDNKSQLNTEELLEIVTIYLSSTDKQVKEGSYAIIESVYKQTRNLEDVLQRLQDKQKAEVERRCKELELAPLEVQVPEPPSLAEASPNLRAQQKLSMQHLEDAAFCRLPEENLVASLDPHKWESSIVNAEKWKMKHEAFELFAKTCEKARRIAAQHPDYTIYVQQMFKTFESEKNLTVVISCARAMASFIQALRSGFQPWFKTTLTMALKRLGDRNKAVVSSILGILHSLCLVASFDPYFADIHRLCSDKNPATRQNVLEFCLFLLCHPNQREMKTRGHQKIIRLAVAMLDDQALNIRNLAVEVLAQLSMDGKSDAVNQALATLGGKSKKLAEDALARMISASTPTGSAATSEPASFQQTKPVQGQDRPGGKSKKTTSQGSGLTPVEVSNLLELEADSMLDTLWKDEPIKALQTKANLTWEEKLHHLETLGAWIKQAKPQLNAELVEATVVWLNAFVLKNFKESNMSIYRSYIQLVLDMVETHPEHFSKCCIATVVTPLLSKISEPKLTESIHRLLTAFAALTSPQFVVVQICPQVASTTNVKTFTEACLWISDAIDQFGLHEFSPGAVDVVLKLIRGVLEKKNYLSFKPGYFPVLKAIYVRDPKNETLEKVLEGKPGILGELKSLPLTQYSYPPPSQLCKESRGQRPASSSLPLPDGLGLQAQDPEAGLQSPSAKSRTHLRDFLNRALKHLSDPQWKVRQQALEDIAKRVAQEGFVNLSPQVQLEIINGIKARIQADPHKIIVREALSVSAELVKPIPSALARKLSRNFLPTLFQKLSEKTQQFREACGTALKAWLEVIGFPMWLTCLLSSQVFKNSHGEETEAVLTIMLSLEEEELEEGFLCPETKAIMKTFLTMLFDFLQNKHQNIRSTAEVLIRRVSKVTPVSLLHQALKSSRTFKFLDPSSHTCASAIALHDTLQHCFLNAQQGQEQFGVRLKRLNSDYVLEKLRECRGLPWNILALDVENLKLLSGAWSCILSDALYAAMMQQESGQMITAAIRFWTEFLKTEDNLLSLAPLTTPEHHCIDLIVHWLQWRLFEAQNMNDPVAVFVLECFMTLVATTDGLQPSLIRDTYVEYIFRDVLSATIMSFLETQLDDNGEMVIRDLSHEILTRIVALKPSEETLMLLVTNITACHEDLRIAYLMGIKNVLVNQAAGPSATTASLLAEKLADLCLKTTEQKVVDMFIDTLGMLSPATAPEEIIRIARTAGFSPEMAARVEASLSTTRTTSSPRSSLKRASQIADSPLRMGAWDAQFDSNLDLAVDSLYAKPLETLYDADNQVDYVAMLDALKTAHNSDPTLSRMFHFLSDYSSGLVKLNDVLRAQDLHEYWRRATEGRTARYDTLILNSYIHTRLKISSVSQGQSLVCLEEIKKLSKFDALLVGETCEKLQCFFDSGLEHSSPRIDWQTVFAIDLIAGLTAALTFCFDPEHLHQLNEEELRYVLAAGYQVILLISRFVKSKEAMEAITPSHLKGLLSQLLAVMTAHDLWSGCEIEEHLVKRMNSIVATHLMQVVDLNSAVHFSTLCIQFLLEERQILARALVIRVHRKLIKKLNSRHKPIASYPDAVKQYLHLLDAALLVFRLSQSDSSLFDVPLLTGDPDSQFQLDRVEPTELALLKTQIYILIRECIFIPIVFLGPQWTGVYFRDCGFDPGPCPDLSLDDPALLNASGDQLRKAYNRLVNQSTAAALETLMNASFPRELTSSVASSSAQQPLHHMFDQWTYQDFHDHVNSITFPPSADQGQFVTPLWTYPPFKLGEFLASAPAHLSLRSVDKDLADGWDTLRQNSVESSEFSTPSIDRMVQTWTAQFEELSQRLRRETKENFFAELKSEQGSLPKGSDPGVITEEFLCQCTLEALNLFNKMTLDCPQKENILKFSPQ